MLRLPWTITQNSNFLLSGPDTLVWISGLFVALAVVLNKCAMMDAHLFDEKIPPKIVKSSFQGILFPLIGFFLRSRGR